MEHGVHDELEAGWCLLLAEGHSDPPKQPLLRCDAKHVLGVWGAPHVMIPCFNIHCRKHMGSGAGVKHFTLVGKWVIDRPGMGVDVNCVVTYAKALPTLLPLDQHEVGRTLHLLCMTYHPTLHKLVQLSCHPLALTLVKVGGGVVAAHM